MKTSPAVALLFGVTALCSCDTLKKITSPGEYHPEYLNESSALDGPGITAARAAQRAALEQEGRYAPGDTPEVQQGKVYLFNRNPDKDADATGKMVNTDKAKVISCQGMYYFVETDDGSKGFVRDTDLVNPVQLVNTTDSGLFLPNGETPGPEGWGEGVAQPEVVQLDANQTLMTNDAGRTVVVVNKKSERNSEFEARKKALQEGQEMPAEAATPAPAEPVYEPLPEPANSGN